MAPNIILIITDHFRKDAPGKHTPNLMNLADRGALFHNAYCASPLCQPARNSIITGLHNFQHGVCGNMNPPISEQIRNDTFMHHLQKAGYYTAMIGKHHYIDRYGIGMDVKEDHDTVCAYGFDHVTQILDDGETRHNDDDYTAYLEEQGKLKQYRDSFTTHLSKYKHPFEEDETADGFIGKKGIEFVEQYSEDRPFYLNIGFLAPHPPLWHPGESCVRPEDTDPPLASDDAEYAQMRRSHYAEKCAIVDRYVGKLTALLEQKDLTDNTMIIFTSDHGDNLGDYGIWDKRFFYEQSAGVPLIMAGPGIPRGARDLRRKDAKALVSHVDLYPTILKIAGADEDSYSDKPGMDILDMLTEKKNALRTQIVSTLGTAVMIRTGNWKLVFDPEQGGVQHLYNMVSDPREQDNLAGKAGYEQAAADLIRKLLAHRIKLTQFTHDKEQQRVQRVRAGY